MSDSIRTTGWQPVEDSRFRLSVRRITVTQQKEEFPEFEERLRLIIRDITQKRSLFLMQ